jgi:hypothetical protein
MQHLFVIILIFLLVNFSFANELPEISYIQQPKLKIDSNKNPVIVKLKTPVKEEKIVEKSQKGTEEKIILNSNYRRTYRNCTSLG